MTATDYRWRDPARITPQRLAELDAHDKHIAGLEAASRMADVRHHGRKHSASRTNGAAATASQRAALNRRLFAGLRAIGYSPAEAAKEIGVHPDTGRKYEARRIYETRLATETTQ